MSFRQKPMCTDWQGLLGSVEGLLWKKSVEFHRKPIGVCFLAVDWSRRIGEGCGLKRMVKIFEKGG